MSVIHFVESICEMSKIKVSVIWQICKKIYFVYFCCIVFIPVDGYAGEEYLGLLLWNTVLGGRA